MKKFDFYLQSQRIKEASKFIEGGSTVADVGCRDGALFKSLGDKLRYGFGFDPYLDSPFEADRYLLKPSVFSVGSVPSESLDCITMLAVLEHLDTASIREIVEAAGDSLKFGGRIVITVPDAKVDLILYLLEKLRIIDGQSLEEHHGYDVKQTRSIFEKSGLFRLSVHKRFQLGLNNLFVFEKC